MLYEEVGWSCFGCGDARRGVALGRNRYGIGYDLYFHDPMAAVGVFHPEIAAYTNAAVSVSVADRGITRYSDDASRPQLKVATEIDFGRFTNEFVRALSTAF